MWHKQKALKVDFMQEYYTLWGVIIVMLNQIINGGFQSNLITTNRSNICLFSLLCGIDCAKTNWVRANKESWIKQWRQEQDKRYGYSFLHCTFLAKWRNITVLSFYMSRLFSLRTWLTFHHHHVDVYGADGRLGQTLALLQDVWNVTRGNPIVGLSSKRHQLPDSHPWMNVKHTVS